MICFGILRPKGPPLSSENKLSRSIFFFVDKTKQNKKTNQKKNDGRIPELLHLFCLLQLTFVHLPLPLRRVDISDQFLKPVSKISTAPFLLTGFYFKKTNRVAALRIAVCTRQKCKCCAPQSVIAVNSKNKVNKNMLLLQIFLLVCKSPQTTHIFDKICKKTPFIDYVIS